MRTSSLHPQINNTLIFASRRAGASGHRRSGSKWGGCMRGSDLLVQSLVQAGVKYVFGMPGHTTLPVLDSISREPSIRFILAKHENTLVSMADGYARVSLEPGV